MGRFAYTAALLTALMGSAGPAWAQRAALVQDVDQAVRDAVVFTSTSINPGVQNLYTVPAGKRLEITFVSATVQASGRSFVDVYCYSNGFTSDAILVSDGPVNDLGGPFFAATQMVSVICDPGTTVQANVRGGNAAATSITVTGRLVSIP